MVMVMVMHVDADVESGWVKYVNDAQDRKKGGGK